MKKNLFIMVFVVALIFAAGCSKADQNEETYKVNGDIDTVEKSGGVVEGIKSEYIIKLTDIQPEDQSNKSEMSSGTFSVTKNTSIYKQSGDKKEKADITAIEKGKSAEITWRFANDHLTEAIEINIK
ncbi:hypothetical protein ACFFSY_08295 [Paenibacillus aurantiacus]|uniref:Lipoprotein n=1 Tax=Paenibacillus aurantiacus TaxID=1936118 RepID=A0ABV5KL14_9BACL